MKYNLAVSLMAILALCGCQREMLCEKTSATEGKTFTAVIEDDLSNTKTSIDAKGNVLWKKGDQISIFDGVTINKQYKATDASDGKTSADFILVSPSGFVGGNEIENNVAFYPYQSTTSITKNEGNYVLQDIELPSKQTYAEGSFGNGSFPMVAVTTSTSDLFLKFKNVLGALKLQLKGTASIVSVSIKGNNNEILYGPATIDISSEFTPTINLTSTSAKTVTLNCGGVQLNNTTATSFVIALPPMTMTGGFTIVVRDTEGKEMEIKTTKSQTITRSNILKMPEVTYEGKEPAEGQEPLTFTSTGATEISLCKTGTPMDITLEYKVNDGVWTSYSIGDVISLSDKDKVSFQAGEGGNSKFSTDSGYYFFKISGSGTAGASGNIMSLVNSNMGTLTIPNVYYFSYLFASCTQLTSAPELPATKLANYCYYNMFFGCTSLTTAPDLPATTLAVCCYRGMFSGCTNLTTAPITLTASVAKNMCCYEMFNGCINLTTAPELPATTLAYNSYTNMFKGCTALTTAPELPATNLYSDCYMSMFDGCTSLTTVPELPATILYERCYLGMFSGCTSLITAPKILATTLSYACCSNMFEGCTSLTSAPKLSATTLAKHCYYYMFSDCTSLTTAPELPAITLTDGCYQGMFKGCTALTTAPELPATTLVDECYRSMFWDCTSLTTAPELPATTLVDECYSGMFWNCKKLNYVKALFTTTPSNSYTGSWMFNVSSTGTFVKSASATWNVTGATGIPSGWTIQTE